MQWTKFNSQELKEKPKYSTQNNSTFTNHVIMEEGDGGRIRMVVSRYEGELKEPYDGLCVDVVYSIDEEKVVNVQIDYDYNAMQLDTLYKIKLIDGQIRAFILRSSGMLEHYVFTE